MHTLGRPIVSVIKPGVKIEQSKLDTSKYGGHSEISGLVGDLRRLEFEVVLNKVVSESRAVFVFPSSNRCCEILDRIKEFRGKRFQCFTDLLYSFSSREIGNFIALNQVPGSPGYFPFERYVLASARSDVPPTSTSFENWQARDINCVYAGGSRNGERDELIKEYTSQGHIDKLIGSFPTFGPVNVEPKIEFFRLQQLYCKSKFALLITDPKYSSFGMRTQRLFEYLMAGTIPIVDWRSAYMVEGIKNLPICTSGQCLPRIMAAVDKRLFCEIQANCNAFLLRSKVRIDEVEKALSTIL